MCQLVESNTVMPYQLQRDAQTIGGLVVGWKTCILEGVSTFQVLFPGDVRTHAIGYDVLSRCQRVGHMMNDER